MTATVAKIVRIKHTLADGRWLMWYRIHRIERRYYDVSFANKWFSCECEYLFVARSSKNTAAVVFVVSFDSVFIVFVFVVFFVVASSTRYTRSRDGLLAFLFGTSLLRNAPTHSSRSDTHGIWSGVNIYKYKMSRAEQKSLEG